MTLSPRQQAVLSFIRSFQIENRVSPSLNEIVIGTHLYSRSGVQQLVERLVTLGHLRKNKIGRICMMKPCQLPVLSMGQCYLALR